MTGDSNKPDDDLIFHKLNQETARINWSELQRYFAKGLLIVVSKELDLVKTAQEISDDQENTVKSYLDSGKIHPASDDEAIRWNNNTQEFWAVVTAPWVLIQEI